MKRYIFTDNDDYNEDEEYDIREDNYRKLIDYCFKYASYFSLDFSETLSSYSQFPLDRIKNLSVLRSEKCKFTDRMIRKYYKCSEEAYSILIEDFGNIFGYLWENHGGPENLTFYRNNDSIILKVITHEGYCNFFPLPHENSVEILNFGHWFEYKEGMYF